MVEERHAHLERVRHRRAVEVMDHVVDQSELPVDVQRRRQRVVGKAVHAGAHGAMRCATVELRERARTIRALKPFVELAAHRE